MSARKPLLDALVSMLTPRDVLVSCLGANARYLPHMEVPSPVFALEGDGSLLMSPNVLATVAAARPPNLSILLWVNGRYESSGGQALPPAPVDWAALARAAGIRHVESVRDVAGLRATFPNARSAGEPAVLVVEVAFDPAEAIPPYSERPDEIRARFRID